MTMSDESGDAGTKPAPASFSLSRWSERKRAVARGEALPEAPTSRPPARDTIAGVAARDGAGSDVAPEKPLPAVESLTFDSDFTVFMTGKVDESVKRAALRTLLHDPRFNVMDGLDVYIDDYSLPDPIPPSMLAELRHSIAVLNPVFPDDENAAVEVANGEAPSVREAAPNAPALTARATEPVATQIASANAAPGEPAVREDDATKAEPAVPEDDATRT